MSRGLGKNQVAVLEVLREADAPVFVPQLRWSVAARLGWPALTRPRRESLRRGLERLISENLLWHQARPYMSIEEAAKLHPFYADTQAERMLKAEVLAIIEMDVSSSPDAPMQWDDLQGENHWLNSLENSEERAEELSRAWAPIERRLRQNLGAGDSATQDWRMALIARGRTIVQRKRSLFSPQPLRLTANASIDELLRLAPEGEATKDLVYFGDLVRPPATRAHMRWKAQLSRYVIFGKSGGRIREDAPYCSFRSKEAEKRFLDLVARHRLPEPKGRGIYASLVGPNLPKSIVKAVDRRVLRHDHAFVHLSGLGAEALNSRDASAR